MPSRPKTRDDDKRGNPGSSSSAPKGQKRAGSELEGVAGNAPHQRSEEAATLVEMLKGFGLTNIEVQQVLERQFDQGFSENTLKRHYRVEMDRGLSVAKSQLLQKAHNMAMGKGTPQGVSADKAYEIASRKVDFLLRVVHGVGGSEIGSGTVTITISPDDAEL